MDTLSVALVCHANALLSGDGAPFPLSEWITPPDAIEFKVSDGAAEQGPEWRIVADVPDAWFGYLREQGAIGVRLHYDDPSGWQEAWKANGLRILIEVVRGGGESDFWSVVQDCWTLSKPPTPPATALAPPDLTRLPPYWRDMALEITHPDYPSPVGESIGRMVLRNALSVPLLPVTIYTNLVLFHARRSTRAQSRTGWLYSYRRLGSGATSDTPRKPVSDASNALVEVLREAHAFGKLHQLNMLDHFVRALAELGHPLTGEPDTRKQARGNRAWAPAGTLAPEAVVLIEACWSAWVFGGMMSWNDGTPSGGPEAAAYTDITNRLYRAIVDGIGAVADSTFPGNRSAGPAI